MEPQRGLITIGRRSVTIVSWIGGISLLFARFIIHLKDIPRSMRVLFEQMYSIGVMSLPLIVIIAIFVGAVSAWQAAYQFKFIGAPLRYLGQAVGKAVIIELGPVLSTLVFAGRVGAGITAELGTMKVTEQIDALDAMGISPNRYLMMPRVLSCMLMVPLLVIFADFVAIIGGLIVSVMGVDVSSETYLNGFRSSFRVMDLVNGLLKAGVFGLVIGLVACFEGFRTKGGAEGVGEATTRSVVISMVLVLVLDFLFTILLFRI